MWNLATERLKLRPLEESDAAALQRTLGDPIAMRFYPRPLDRAMTEAWVRSQLDRYERDGIGLLAVVERRTGELIGDCGPTMQLVRGDVHVELGWHVRRDRQGHGFASEAARACRDEAWRHDVDHLISLVRPENVPSWRIARGLGFHPWTADVRVGMAHVVWRTERGVWAPDDHGTR